MDHDDGKPGLEPLYQALAAFGREFSAAVNAWLEQMGPSVDALLEVAGRPEVQAALERARAQPRPRPCYCFCQRLHPGDKGICDGQGVTTRRFTAEATGPVDVSLCAPCAVAQGLAELGGGSRPG